MSDQPNHKTTFQLTPQKRPLYKRMTPLAWLLIGTAVVLTAVLAFSLFQGREKDEPLGLPAASAPAAAEAQAPAAALPTTAPPTATALPPTPTQWQVEETVASTAVAPPTVVAASATPEGRVWWAEQMACDEQGSCTPPAEVADAVVAAYWEWRTAIPFYYYELDMTPEQLEYHYIGEMLDLQLEFIALVAETGAMWDGETIVKEFEVERRHSCENNSAG